MRNFWTAEDDALLTEKYVTMTASEIGVLLGRSRAAIKCRINILGLKLPEHIRKERCDITKFNKGNVPFNKGKKQTEYMSQEPIEATKAGWFKKGGLPHNTKLPYSMSVRKDKCGQVYQFIRVSKRNWVHYHRFVYEKAFGPIPKDKLIRFKDGNSLNCDLSNLELMSKGENMLLNSIHNYPKEIKDVIRLKGKINKKITKLQNNGKEQN